MEEVALLCEVEPDTFLVPCLLPAGSKPSASPGHRIFFNFKASFLPDSLFRRLICYAVQKSSSKEELFASKAFMAFEGHDCCITAHLEQDLIQVDVFSKDFGPWLVLHTLTNLVEHLRLDFMREIRYEALRFLDA